MGMYIPAKNNSGYRSPCATPVATPWEGATAAISNPKENSAIVASTIERANPGISNGVLTPKKNTLPTVSIANAIAARIMIDCYLRSQQFGW